MPTRRRTSHRPTSRWTTQRRPRSSRREEPDAQYPIPQYPPGPDDVGPARRPPAAAHVDPVTGGHHPDERAVRYSDERAEHGLPGPTTGATRRRPGAGAL